MNGTYLILEISDVYSSQLRTFLSAPYSGRSGETTRLGSHYPPANNRIVYGNFYYAEIFLPLPVTNPMLVIPN